MAAHSSKLKDAPRIRFLLDSGELFLDPSFDLSFKNVSVTIGEGQEPEPFLANDTEPLDFHNCHLPRSAEVHHD
jgi:hypothetical protein